MSLWFREKAVTINLVLIVVLLSCYLITMFLLPYYTEWAWPHGQWGGAFTYVLFRISTICHLTTSGLQPVFYLPDIVPYILMAIIIFNLLMLFSGKLSSSEIKLYFAQTAIAALCLTFYMYIMMFLGDALKYLGGDPALNGYVVFYYPCFAVGASITYQGAFESRDAPFPDVTTWLIIILLVVAIGAMRRQRRKENQGTHETEKQTSALQKPQ
jgi:hypothetical protein